MHVDAAVRFLIADLMCEVREKKVSAQFPIDPSEEIAVEGGGHSGGVIIGEPHVTDRFLQIGPQEQRVAGL